MSAHAITGEQRKHLRIYLNDHLMGAAGGMALARRCLSGNRGTPLGDTLERLLEEIAEDRASLEELMELLGFPQDRLKLVAAAVGEKLGRFKLNGHLLAYSDLSRLVELEGLLAGVSLKRRLWQVLREVASADRRLAGVDFDRLLDRASRQLETLNAHRLEAARRAFTQGAGGGASPGQSATG